MKLFVIIILILLTACNDKAVGPIPAGGPCSYKTYPFHFTVLTIEKDSSASVITSSDKTNPDTIYPPDSLFKARIKLCCGPLSRDTVYLQDLTDKSFTISESRLYGLTEGKIIDGTVDRITTGTCKSEVYKFNNPYLN